MTPLSHPQWDRPTVLDTVDYSFPTVLVTERLTPVWDEQLQRWAGRMDSKPWLEFAVQWETGFQYVHWLVHDHLDVWEVKRHLEVVSKGRGLHAEHRRAACAALSQRWMPFVPEYKAAPAGLVIARDSVGKFKAGPA